MPTDEESDHPTPTAVEGSRPRPRSSKRPKVAPQGVKKGVGWVLAAGGGVATLSGIVNDILIPNSPWLSGTVLGAAALGLLVTLLPATIIPKVPGRKFVIRPRRRTTQSAFAVTAALATVALGFQIYGPRGGVIAANVPLVRDWQVQLGVVAANTTRIADDVAVIKDELKDVKQETSEDPRKELANLGVAWTTQAFVSALMLSDERTVRLFLDGGMTAATDHKGAAAVAFILQPGLTVSPVPMLTLLVEKGFDLDTILTDNYILPNPDDPNSIFPPQWENQDPYLYVGKGAFRGPALLWVVMEAIWYGPTPHDFETLHFLIDHGADRSITMNYMNSAAAWNDTPPYFTVLELLKG